jgi:hypothetical protein
MEKQIKILLGLGAVIAAYLILKPKKAAGQSDPAQPEEKDSIFDADFNVNTRAEYLCPDGYVVYTSMFDSSGNQIYGQRQFCGDKDGKESTIVPVKNPNYERVIIKKPLTPKDCVEAKENRELFNMAYGARTASGIDRGDTRPWFLKEDNEIGYGKQAIFVDDYGDVWGGGLLKNPIIKRIELTPEEIAAQELQKQQRAVEKARLKAEYMLVQERAAKAQNYAIETIKSIGLSDCYNEWYEKEQYYERQIG